MKNPLNGLIIDLSYDGNFDHLGGCGKLPWQELLLEHVTASVSLLLLGLVNSSSKQRHLSNHALIYML